MRRKRKDFFHPDVINIFDIAIGFRLKIVHDTNKVLH